MPNSLVSKGLTRVVVTGAAGQIAYSLIFRIASGEFLGPETPISLRLLDVAVPEIEKKLSGTVMELEDCAFPLVKEIVASSDPNVVFDKGDYFFLVGAKPRGPGMERKDLLEGNAKIFVEQGKVIGERASKDALILVVGNPCNTNCLIAATHASKAGRISKRQFFGMSALDEHRAKTMIAKKMDCELQAISNMVVWGNHSPTMAVDFVNVKINGNTPKIDQKWAEESLTPDVQKRGATVINARGLSSAASAAHAALWSMKRMIEPTAENETFSCSVYTEDNPYGFDKNLYFSMPCRSKGLGHYEIVPDFDIKSNKFLAQQIALTEKELKEERTSVVNMVDILETGLRGVAIGYCTTSFADPYKGLHYISHPVSEMGKMDPEEVIYLLYHKAFAKTKEELEAFKQQLKKRQVCSDKFIASIKALPKNGDPMKLFSAALLLLGMDEQIKDYKEGALSVIAKMPHLIALLINEREGFGATPLPDANFGYIENFVNMLQLPNKNSKLLTETFKLFNILHYDHGGGNLSTFVGKAVASGHEDLYGSLAASMSALEGPLHGGANRDALEFVKEVHSKLGDNPSTEAIATFITEKLDSNASIFGFGHAVLRVEDPRATLLYDFAQSHFPTDPLVKTAQKLRLDGVKTLASYKKKAIGNPYPNVDAISGIVLQASGFNYPDYYTLLFGMSRVVGISIQIIYERCEARGGKGTPIVRPRYVYKGPAA